MKGKILEFNIQSSSGVISGNDGSRYNFSTQDWKSDMSPATQQLVDFTIEGERAMGVYLESIVNSQVSIENSQVSTLAIVSLVSGIIGLFTGFIAIIAIITGHLARSNVKNSNGQVTGSGLALAGLILGYLTIGISVIFLVGFGAAFGGAMGMFG